MHTVSRLRLLQDSTGALTESGQSIAAARRSRGEAKVAGECLRRSSRRTPQLAGVGEAPLRAIFRSEARSRPLA